MKGFFIASITILVATSLSLVHAYAQVQDIEPKLSLRDAILIINQKYHEEFKMPPWLSDCRNARGLVAVTKDW